MQGVKWLSSSAVENCRRRPSDLFLGAVAATLCVYFFVGPNSFFSTMIDIIATSLLMLLMWYLVSKVSDMAENSVFKLPDDERTREAEKLVEAMVDAALD